MFQISGSISIIVYLLIFLNTCLLPVFAMLVLKRMGLISSLHIDIQTERSLPYFITFCFYLSTWWLIYKAPLPEFIANLLLGAAIAILLAGIINYKVKISSHLIGVGGAVGAFLAVNLYSTVDFSFFFIVSILLAGLMGWARLELRAHQPIEVYSGFLLGVFSQLAAFIL